MEKKFICATAANGLTVRIPAERYPQWKKAQDEIRAGTRKTSVQTEKQLRSLMTRKK